MKEANFCFWGNNLRRVKERSKYQHWVASYASTLPSVSLILLIFWLWALAYSRWIVSPARFLLLFKRGRLELAFPKDLLARKKRSLFSVLKEAGMKMWLNWLQPHLTAGSQGGVSWLSLASVLGVPLQGSALGSLLTLTSVRGPFLLLSVQSRLSWLSTV